MDIFVAGRWLTYPSEKYMSEVSWDDDIPNTLWSFNSLRTGNWPSRNSFPFSH